MPRINYILDQLREKRYISSLDGYWQIPLKENSRQYTAIAVGAKLSQDTEKGEKVISYSSRTLNGAE